MLYETVEGGMEVWRGGITSRYVAKEKTIPTASTRGAHDSDLRPGVRFRFRLKSKGLGHTRVNLWVAPTEFKMLAARMMRADPKLAQRAFLEAMLRANQRSKKVDSKDDE